MEVRFLKKMIGPMRKELERLNAAGEHKKMLVVIIRNILFDKN